MYNINVYIFNIFYILQNLMDLFLYTAKNGPFAFFKVSFFLLITLSFFYDFYFTIYISIMKRL